MNRLIKIEDLLEGDWIFKNKKGKIIIFNDKYVNKNFEQYDNQ